MVLLNNTIKSLDLNNKKRYCKETIANSKATARQWPPHYAQHNKDNTGHTRQDKHKDKDKTSSWNSWEAIQNRWLKSIS